MDLAIKTKRAAKRELRVKCRPITKERDGGDACEEKMIGGRDATGTEPADEPSLIPEVRGKAAEISGDGSLKDQLAKQYDKEGETDTKGENEQYHTMLQNNYGTGDSTKTEPVKNYNVFPRDDVLEKRRAEVATKAKANKKSSLSKAPKVKKANGPLLSKQSLITPLLNNMKGVSKAQSDPLLKKSTTKKKSPYHSIIIYTLINLYIN